MMTATAPHPQSTTPAARHAAGLATTVLAGHGREAVADIAPPAAFAGRNGTWNMRLRSGEKVFVKHISAQASGPMSFGRSVAFAAFAEQSPPECAPATPQLIGSDAKNGLLVLNTAPPEPAWRSCWWRSPCRTPFRRKRAHYSPGSTPVLPLGWSARHLQAHPWKCSRLAFRTLATLSSQWRRWPSGQNCRMTRSWLPLRTG